jgi:hypothetical protein
MSLSLFELLKSLADFQEIWFEFYDVGRPFKPRAFNLIEFVAIT